MPSRCEARTNRSNAAEQPVDVGSMPEQHHPSRRRGLEHAGAEGVGPVGVGPADDHQADRGGEAGHRFEQLDVALLGHQTPDRADHHRVVIDAPRPAHVGPVGGGERIGPEPAEVDAVAEVAEPGPGGEVEPAHELDVLHVLHQLQVRPP